MMGVSITGFGKKNNRRGDLSNPNQRGKTFLNRLAAAPLKQSVRDLSPMCLTYTARGIDIFMGLTNTIYWL
jgi:hypothetical protein